MTQDDALYRFCVRAVKIENVGGPALRASCGSARAGVRAPQQ
jgi:hypothetical protein